MSTLLRSFSPVLGLLLLAGCDQQNNSLAVNAAAVVEDGEVKVVADQTTLRTRFHSLSLERAPIHEQDDIRKELALFNDFSVEGVPGAVYLIGKGKDPEGNCVTTAFRLVQTAEGLVGPLGDGQAFSSGDTHSCKGQGCSKCVFTRTGGEIDGCDCERGPAGGWCDHTVTSGDDGPGGST